MTSSNAAFILTTRANSAAESRLTFSLAMETASASLMENLGDLLPESPNKTTM